MSAKPRWLLAIPDAISQLEQLDRTLLTRRDIERLLRYLAAAELEEPKAALFQSLDRAGERLTGRPLTRRVVLAMIKAAGRCRGAPALDLLPHVPGDGDHGVPLERGKPRARPADCGARVPEDDEALRPDRSPSTSGS